MKNPSTMLNIRLDSHVKEQASITLASMGLTITEAVRVFLAKVIAEKAIPFALHAPREPNAESQQAILEAKEWMNAPRPGFKTAEELFDALDK